MPHDGSELAKLFFETWQAGRASCPAFAFPFCASVEVLSPEAWEAKAARVGVTPSVFEAEGVKHTTWGVSLPIPGDRGAPEMRQRVMSAALALAELPIPAFFEVLTGVPAEDPNARMPSGIVWPSDGRALFAEGRLYRPEGNLLGGNGFGSEGDFEHDMERVRKVLGDDLVVIVPAREDAKRIVPAYFARELSAKRSMLWISGNLDAARQDWFVFKTPSSEARALVFYVQEPTAWEIPGVSNEPLYAGGEHKTPAFSSPPKLYVASRMGVAIKHPGLCMKIEHRS